MANQQGQKRKLITFAEYQERNKRQRITTGSGSSAGLPSLPPTTVKEGSDTKTPSESPKDAHGHLGDTALTAVSATGNVDCDREELQSAHGEGHELKLTKQSDALLQEYGGKGQGDSLEIAAAQAAYDSVGERNGEERAQNLPENADHDVMRDVGSGDGDESDGTESDGTESDGTESDGIESNDDDCEEEISSDEGESSDDDDDADADIGLVRKMKPLESERSGQQRRHGSETSRVTAENNDRGAASMIPGTTPSHDEPILGAPPEPDTISGILPSGPKVITRSRSKKANYHERYIDIGPDARRKRHWLICWIMLMWSDEPGSAWIPSHLRPHGLPDSPYDWSNEFLEKLWKLAVRTKHNIHRAQLFLELAPTRSRVPGGKRGRRGARVGSNDLEQAWIIAVERRAIAREGRIRKKKAAKARVQKQKAAEARSEGAKVATAMTPIHNQEHRHDEGAPTTEGAAATRRQDQLPTGQDEDELTRPFRRLSVVDV